MAIPCFLSFRFGFEDEGDQKCEEDCGGNAAGTGGEAACKSAEKALFLHGLFHAFGQIEAKTGEGDRGSGSAPIDDGLVKTECAKYDAAYHVRDENAGRG